MRVDREATEAVEQATYPVQYIGLTSVFLLHVFFCWWGISRSGEMSMLNCVGRRNESIGISEICSI